MSDTKRHVSVDEMNKRTMFPSQLAMLIRCYYSGYMRTSHEDDRESLENALSVLIKNALVTDGTDGYTVTDRGKVYVESLLETPLPIQKWVM